MYLIQALLRTPVKNNSLCKYSSTQANECGTCLSHSSVETIQIDPLPHIFSLFGGKYHGISRQKLGGWPDRNVRHREA